MIRWICVIRRADRSLSINERLSISVVMLNSCGLESGVGGSSSASLGLALSFDGELDDERGTSLLLQLHRAAELALGQGDDQLQPE